MNIVLLSGGSGKRLWPLSNDIRSKQFIKIFRMEDGSYESMVQRMYRMLREVDRDAVITIATSKSQVSSIHNQIGTGVGISVEPCRRDTFPAIALAASYLRHVQGVGMDEPVIVCPIDPYVDPDYFKALSKLSEHVASTDTHLSLMGIEPTYPSEKYGYVIPEDMGEFSPVSAFKEKPDKETAAEYIKQGALWNAGVFGFRLRYLLDKTEEILGTSDYRTLFDTYETLTKISFDYAVGEKETSIDVLRFSGEWKDLGTWNTLTEAMDDSATGKTVVDSSCENVNVVNELDVPVVCMGLKNVVVAASAEGVFVSDKEASSHNKPVVDKIEQQVMFADKSWGSFRVLDVGPGSMTNKITVLAGKAMNYHSHAHRDEIWNIVSGRGTVIVDGMKQPVSTGDVVTMAAGCRHTVVAETELCLIEVQIGEAISVHDKTKYKLDI